MVLDRNTSRERRRKRRQGRGKRLPRISLGDAEAAQGHEEDADEENRSRSPGSVGCGQDGPADEAGDVNRVGLPAGLTCGDPATREASQRHPPAWRSPPLSGGHRQGIAATPGGLSAKPSPVLPSLHRDTAPSTLAEEGVGLALTLKHRRTGRRPRACRWFTAVPSGDLRGPSTMTVIDVEYGADFCASA